MQKIDRVYDGVVTEKRYSVTSIGIMTVMLYRSALEDLEGLGGFKNRQKKILL